MPFYGRAFSNTLRLGQSCAVAGMGSWESGVWDNKALPLSNGQPQPDLVSRATYTHYSTARQLISFDTVDMVTEKVQYLKRRRSGGRVFWEASGDQNDS
jgi:chitinase